CFDFITSGSSASSSSHTVMSGTLVQYTHTFADDSAIALCMDDKWLLSKVTVFGRMTYDPLTGRHYFDAAAPCNFNELGYPNCIDSPYGPRFAPAHRFGFKAAQGSEDYSEPSVGSATTRARSWTVQDIFNYLRSLH